MSEPTRADLERWSHVTLPRGWVNRVHQHDSRAAKRVRRALALNHRIPTDVRCMRDLARLPSVGLGTLRAVERALAAPEQTEIGGDHG